MASSEEDKASETLLDARGSECKRHQLPVDRGWAWAVAVGAAINTFWSLGSFSVYGMIFVEVIEVYQASSTLSSVMFGVFMATCGVAVLIQCLITGKASERTISCIAGVSFSLSLILQFFSPNVYFFVIIFGVLGGVGSTFTMYTGIVVLGIYFNKKLSIASGLAFVGASCGQFIIPQILKLLFNHYGFKGAMLIFGACHLHPLVSGMLFRPPSFYKCNCKGINKKQLVLVADLNETGTENVQAERPLSAEPLVQSAEEIDQSGANRAGSFDGKSSGTSKSFDDKNEDDESVRNGVKFNTSTDVVKTGSRESIQKVSIEIQGANDPKNYTIKESFRILGLMPRFYLFAAGRCLCVIANYLLILFIPPLATSHGFTRGQVSMLLTIMGAIDLPSRPLHGWLVSLKQVDVTYYIGITSLVCSVIVFVCTFIPSTVSVYMMGILMTVLYNPNLCLMNVITIESVGKDLFARALMLFMMVTYGMLTFLPLVFGRLYDVLDSYTVPMAICAGCGVTGGIITVIEKRCRI